MQNTVTITAHAQSVLNNAAHYSVCINKVMVLAHATLETALRIAAKFAAQQYAVNFVQ